MAETVIPYYMSLEKLVEKDGKKSPELYNKKFYQWPKQNLFNDITEIGGLNPDLLEIYEGVGKANYLEVYKINYNRNEINMRWVHDTFLLIAMKEEDSMIKDAFTKVMGYSPFVRYKDPVDNMITYEWDNVDKEKRFKFLEMSKKLELDRMIK
ncbi:MAG: hypothetical protein WC867_02165 [Candidatus Pacearchaeota archaeon]|jgi:hypothetical protein